MSRPMLASRHATHLILVLALLVAAPAAALSIIADGTVHTARIEYEAGSLAVFLDDMLNPAVTAMVNVDNAAVLNGGSGWVGFTSAQGSGDADVDILNWSFTNGSSFSFANFSSVDGLNLAGSASQSTDRLRLVSGVAPPGAYYQTGAAWFAAQQFVEDGFSTTFDFQITAPNLADGFVFVVQSSSPTALGGCGFGLGYLDGDNVSGACDFYGDPGTIPGALAVEFDSWENTSQLGSWPPEYIGAGLLLGGVQVGDDHIAVVSTIPEPSTALLLALGLMALAAGRRRR